MSKDSTPKEWLVELIKKRRTRKPIYFDGKVPSERIEHLIDVARNAPNHHRTEPAGSTSSIVNAYAKSLSYLMK